MAKLSTGQKRRQKELKRRKKKQLQVKKQQASTSMTFMDLPSGLPKLSERLSEFAGTLLDGTQTGRNYIENIITMVAGCWNMGAVTEARALEMREELSEGLRQLQPELLEVMEPHFDRLITARRFFYADDPRFIVSHDVTWTGPNDYYLQIASINLSRDERYSGSVAGTGLSAEWQDKMKAYLTQSLTEEEIKLNQLIDQGFEVLRDNKTTTDFDKSEAAACETWLDAWEIIKELYQDKTSLDIIGSRMEFILYSWSSVMDMHLLNAAIAEPSFIEKGITFFREFLEHFPESEEDTHKAYRRAMAQLQFRARTYEEGDATFTALVKDFPDSAWSYIGWGDIYNPTFSRAHYGDVPADIERAKQLYQIPVDRKLEDADHARERLDQLLAFARDETATLDA
ncbi:hypothetical protein [Endozoicomonas sp. GU-1]|uniref:hypothetical protein n=1 Tax=Endozoicomonas sp. GU-1 TaxID=3009078 RepID=UPI0022B3880D|nr:hypothetical protein [Endozoicomonas sp. GU-1]WBA81462.1 hypothetical protein O2T12_24825 [Endozoicomonas sp. GU-1]WBA84409.1 hypothetical protein O3276_13985 [Endozoicomonas sp. GU-1]